MSEEWRRIAGFQRSVSNLRLSVTADAEIQIRTMGGGTVIDILSLPAGGSWQSTSVIALPWLINPFSVWLKSDDPNCQCQIQAEYSEDVTRRIDEVVQEGVIRALDMRFLYGPMGLGIPLSVTGNPLDYQIRAPRPYDIVRERYMQNLREEVKAEPPKEEKPSPGITRLQAFKRELEEEKPKKKEVRKKKW